MTSIMDSSLHSFSQQSSAQVCFGTDTVLGNKMQKRNKMQTLPSRSPQSSGGHTEKKVRCGIIWRTLDACGALESQRKGMLLSWYRESFGTVMLTCKKASREIGTISHCFQNEHAHGVCDLEGRP